VGFQEFDGEHVSPHHPWWNPLTGVGDDGWHDAVGVTRQHEGCFSIDRPLTAAVVHVAMVDTYSMTAELKYLGST